MPTPVSVTSISTVRPSLRVETVIAVVARGRSAGDCLRGVDQEVHDDLAEAAVVHQHRRHLVEAAARCWARSRICPRVRLSADSTVRLTSTMVRRLAVGAGRAGEEAEIAGDVDDAADRLAQLAQRLGRARGDALVA